MSTRNADRSTGRPVAAVSAALTAAAVALLWLAWSRPVPVQPGDLRAPWWALAPLFALAQAGVMHVQIRREARAVSLSEVPAVLGLFLLSPAGFLASRVLGGVAAQLAARRQYRHPIKLAFNTVLVTAEAAAALGIFALVDAGATIVSPSAWTAAVVAAVAANLVSGIGVSTLIALIEQRRVVRSAVAVIPGAVPTAAVGAIVGLVAALALEYNPWAAIPLAGVAAMVLGAYRAYASLVERHDNVERLYQFSQLVSANTDSDSTLASMLDHVCVMLFATSAHVTFFSANDLRPETEAVLVRGGRLTRRPPHYLSTDTAWLVDALAREGKPLLLPRDTRDVAAQHWLESRGVRDAILVPLRGEHGIVGALGVSDRLGDSRGFDAGDMQVLETVANHTSIALRHGELVDRLRHDSLHDALTGIPNRAYLQLEVERRFTMLSSGGNPFAVAMLDLDAFKDVNDTLGHHHGDVLLQEVAARLTTAAAGRGLVSRFGGDEFALLLPDCHDEDTVHRLCRVLLDALQLPVLIDGTAVDVGASLGVALAPAHADTMEQLFKRADLAMYVAKQGGREAVVFDPTHETTSPARLAMVAALRQAICDGNIDVFVQPQLRLGGGDIVSVEALARWTDPERGVVAPDEFIALAERSGLIRPLTDLVLDKAIAACAAWQAFAPGVAVAVNLSARSLRDDALDAHIDRLLRRNRLPAHLVTLEITESSVMADPAGTIGLLHRLRLRGVRLSIDDFGTGYSSLAYLRRLPVQEVKVDRSFVHRMDTESDDAAIVHAIIEMAHTLELAVVAEGIENGAIIGVLERLRCDLGQGYHIAKPMPVAEFADWFRSRPWQPRRGLVAVHPS